MLNKLVRECVIMDPIPVENKKGTETLIKESYNEIRLVYIESLANFDIREGFC